MGSKNALNSIARVAIHDDPHPLVIAYMSNLTLVAATVADAAMNQRFVKVDDATGMGLATTDYFILFSTETNRFFQGTILAIVGDVVELDTPLDSFFPAGSFVDVGTRDLAVDGSSNPVTYGLRGSPRPDAIQASAHINRILLQITCESAPDFGKFGDLDALTKGLVLRSVDGITNNIFNAKTNADLALLAYDYTPYDASNPGQGVYGISVRLTFSGQSKLGSTIAIGPGDDLNTTVQDDLSDLLTFRIAAEGHISELFT